MKYDVGAVIIGRNEERRLAACLESLIQQVSVAIYVDSGSTDRSVELARRYGVEVVSLKCGPYTAARGRNEGLAEIRRVRPDLTLIQFCDGDCTLDAQWIAAASNFMGDQPEVAVVCGRRRELNPGASIYNRLCDMEWDTPVGQTLSCGGDSLMRVQALEAVGGFRSELMAGEEPELCLRLREKGWKIWRLDAEMTVHDVGMTRLSQWWRRAVRFGYGTAELNMLHQNSLSGGWRKQLVSSTLWGGAIPVCICVMGLFYPIVFVALIVYPVQIVRIAVSRDARSSVSWKYAALIMVAKFAEFGGLMKFLWRKLVRTRFEPIEYK